MLSLLPAPLHATVAEQCIAARTPLVTASYVAPELAALHERARVYISPISPYISPVSPIYLPYISHISPLLHERARDAPRSP